MSTQVIASNYAVASDTVTSEALLARLERLPITRRLKAIRVIVGLSTFYDAYTIIAIAFALPHAHSGVGTDTNICRSYYCG